MLVDARGQGCPRPVIMAEDALLATGEGIIEMLVDDEASVNNLARFASKNGFFSEVLREEGHWRVKIAKGNLCEAAQAVSSQRSALPGADSSEAQKGLFLVIGSDVMGKDEELGRILMKAYFETLKAYREIPQTIFFLNAGVKLTTTDTDIALLLKDLETAGAEIFSCGTCLKYYKLEDKLRVGFRGATNQIVEAMKDVNKQTVWIG